MQVVGNESRPRALDFVRPRLDLFTRARLRDDRRIFRFHRDDLDARLAFFEHLAHAGAGATGADRGNENVDLAVRVVPDFLGCCLRMDVRICRILELLRHPAIRGFLEDLLRFGDCTLHALRSRREDKLGSEHGEEGAPLHAHSLGHGEDEFVSCGRRDESERDARVAAGRFDDDRFFFEDPLFLGVIDHRHADAILHAAERIEELALERDRGSGAFGDLVQFDQRRAADGLDNVFVNFAHSGND